MIFSFLPFSFGLSPFSFNLPPSTFCLTMETLNAAPVLGALCCSVGGIHKPR
jgi:hypothetical protein